MRDHKRDYGNYLADTILTGISTISAVKPLYPYPNPAATQVKIDLEGDLTNAKATVINLMGQTVLTYDNFEKNSSILNVSGLTKGVYIIQIQNNGQIYTGKFAKQ